MAQPASPGAVRPIAIAAGEHLFACGMTGAGKTTGIKRLLFSVPRYDVIDPKHLYGSPGVPIVDGHRRELPRQIIRMPRGANTYQAWGNQIDKIYRDGDRVIYIDECTACTPAQRLPDAYDWALRTGREHGISLWSATQTPVGLPSMLLNQARHVLIFFLSGENEIQKILNHTHWILEGPVRELRLHDFVYFDRENPEDWRFYQGDKWADGEAPAFAQSADYDRLMPGRMRR